MAQITQKAQITRMVQITQMAQITRMAHVAQMAQIAAIAQIEQMAQIAQIAHVALIARIALQMPQFAICYMLYMLLCVCLGCVCVCVCVCPPPRHALARAWFYLYSLVGPLCPFCSQSPRFLLSVKIIYAMCGELGERCRRFVPKLTPCAQIGANTEPKSINRMSTGDLGRRLISGAAFLIPMILF